MLQDLELQSTSVIKNFENNQLLQNSPTVSSAPAKQRNFGKCLVFFFLKGEPLFTIGPHCTANDFISFVNLSFHYKGHLFLCMFTTFLVSGLMIAFLVAKHTSETSFYLMLVVTGLQNITYLITALKNPGLISSSQELDEQALKSGE